MAPQAGTLLYRRVPATTILDRRQYARAQAWPMNERRRMNDESFDQISKNLCDAIGMLEHSGLVDYNGHVSCRMADGSIAINSGASNRADLGQGDITVVNADGQTQAGRLAAPRERFLHTQLYAARSDVHAI